MLGHLADDATRVDAGFMQHQPHLAQRIVGNGPLGEDGRIEIDEDRRFFRQACAGIQEVERARQRLDMQAVGCGASAEEHGRRLRFAIAKRPNQPLEGDKRQLPRLESEDRLERALQRIDAPDTGGGAVFLTDDVGKPNAARQGSSLNETGEITRSP